MQGEIGGPIATQVYVPINLQFRVLELRAARNMGLRTLRYRVNGEVTRKLVIESEIVKVKCGVDDWFFQRSGSRSRKAHPALDGYTAALKRSKSRQIKVCSRRIQAEVMRREIVSCVTGDTSILLDHLDVGELRFSTPEMQVPGDSLERLAI